MNKKYIMILSLIITFEALLYCGVALTDREITLLDDVESMSRPENMILTLNLPLIGELDLYHYFDPQDRNLIFVNKKKINLDLSPAPIQLEEVHIVENLGDLEFRAKAKIFGRNAAVSLVNLKRAAEIKIIENEKNTKLFLDISEMTLLFNFNELTIKLLNESNLNFSSATFVLRKNKPHQFLVKNTILDQPVDFNFIFSADGITSIKYFVTKDILLSKLFTGIESDFHDITLKSLSLTTEYKSSDLFSQSNFRIHGNAFADIKLTGEKLPINLIDLPAILDYVDNKYSLEVKLPKFNLPLLGIISKGYLKLSDSFPLQLLGEGVLNLPQIGKHKYELDAIYQNGKMLLRGKLDHSIKFSNFVLESPKFTYNLTSNSLRIFGKSKLHDIKCLIDLTFKNVDLLNQMVPELRIKTLQKSWKPFIDSPNMNLANIELRMPHVVITNEKGKQEITVIGKTKLLQNDVNAQINFVNSAKGVVPVLKVTQPEAWKISDSFGHIKEFDDLMFNEPQFVISDTAFYDPNREIYLNKGINFKGKLLLNKTLAEVRNLIALTDGDIMISGSVSDDFNNFVWQAPLATGLATKSKLLHMGPMNLELSSNAPLSLVSRISVHPTEKEVLDFTGNFTFNENKLNLNSVYPGVWTNVFSISGINMINPKLHVTLDKDNFSSNSLPDEIILEGDINLGNNKMYARSIMNTDFSKFSLVGHCDQFWLNELADIFISNKHTYSILPPLEIKNIAFDISPNAGLRLDGSLGIFGLDISVHGSVNNAGLKIAGTLPKMIAPGIEIYGLDHKNGPELSIELNGEKDQSKMIGILRFGDLLEIRDPITVTAQGCAFNSNTTIGRQKFGVNITAKSLGFIRVPQFNLDIVFNNDSINYFKTVISKELAVIDQNLKKEVNTVISDIKILENNADSIKDPEQNNILIWALDENKRKVNGWLERGLIRLNKKGIYSYHGIANRFDLTEIKFNGQAEKIIDSKIPLIFNVSILGKKHEIAFVIDFANLTQNITEFVQKIKRFAH